MERQDHKVLAWWPEFNNAPVGRMNYFVSYLKLLGVCFVGLVPTAILIEEGGEAGAMIGTTLMLAFGIWSMAHSVSLIYKRIWDIGFEEEGSRAGMTVGAIVLGFVPVADFIIGLALLFWPRKNEETEVEA